MNKSDLSLSPLTKLWSKLSNMHDMRQVGGSLTFLEVKLNSRELFPCTPGPNLAQEHCVEGGRASAFPPMPFLWVEMAVLEGLICLTVGSTCTDCSMKHPTIVQTRLPLKLFHLGKLVIQRKLKSLLPLHCTSEQNRAAELLGTLVPLCWSATWVRKPWSNLCHLYSLAEF